MHKIRKLLMRIDSRTKLLWFILKLFPQYIKDVLYNRFKHLQEYDKKIIFHLDDDRLFRDNDNSGREAYQIMKTFSDGGDYDVYFYRKEDFKSYYRLRKYGRLIYTIKNLKLIQEFPSNTQDFIYAFD